MIHLIEIDKIKITDNLIKIYDFNVEFDKNDVLFFIHYRIGVEKFYYVPKTGTYKKKCRLKKTFYINIAYNNHVSYIYLSLDNVLKYKINFWDLIYKINDIGDKIYFDSTKFCIVKKFDIKDTLNGEIKNKQFYFDKKEEIFIFSLDLGFESDTVQYIFSKKEFYDFYFKKKTYLKYNKTKMWIDHYFVHFMPNSNNPFCILRTQVDKDIKDIIEKYRTYIMYNYYYKKIINLFNNRLDRYITDNIFEFILGISLLKNN